MVLWQIISMITRKEKQLVAICREFLKYDKLSGKVVWIKQKGAAKANRVAGYKSKKTGWTIRLNGRNYQLTHIIWLMTFARFPKKYIDHIDHDPCNNRLENLREVSHQGNLKNMSLKKNNTSGVCGVYFCKDRKKWSAFIRDNGKIVALGRREKFEEAVQLRKRAEITLGYHPNHGVKKCS